MKYDLLFSLLVLIIACIAAFSNFRLTKLVYLLIFGLVTLLLSNHVDESGKEIVYAAAAIFCLGTVLQLFSFSAKRIVRILFGLAATGVLLLLSKDAVVTLFGEKTAVINKFVVGGLVLSALAFEVADIKKFFLQKMKWESPDISSSVESILIALVLFLGGFGASYIGLFLVTTLLLVQALFAGKIERIILLLSGFILYPIITLGETPQLMQADVILGVLLGVGVGQLVLAVSEHKTDGIKWKLITILIATIFSIGLGFAGTMFSSMGGTDSIYALLFGIGLIAATRKGSELLNLVFLTGVAVALYFNAAKTENVEPEIGTTIGSKEPKAEVKDLPDYIPFDSEVSGEYLILPDSSRVDFNLGEKDVTKGAFKKVQGTIALNIEKTEVRADITLNMKDFTTFNKFRDESLMGDEYFKTDVYPEMKYVARKLEKIDERNFKLIGEFKMLGKSNPLNMSLQRLPAKDGFVRITGSAEIDRTTYGMTPSIAEGNVVRFTYSALLKTK